MMSWGFSRRFQRNCILGLLVIAFQYFVVYCCWRKFSCLRDVTAAESHSTRLKGRISCIFLDFDPEYHDLEPGLTSLARLDVVEKLIVVSPRKLYPPLREHHRKLIFGQQYADLSSSTHFGPHVIETEWVMLVPDAVFFESPQFHFEEYLKEAEKNTLPSVRIFAFKVRGKRAICHSVLFDAPAWTLHLNSSSSSVCDSITETVVYLMRTSDYLLFSDPFAVPVGESLLLQSIPRKWKTRLFTQTPFSRTSFLLDPQVIAHYLQRRTDQLKVLYEKFDVKKVVTNGNELLYGCSKLTSRCFGNIFNETPSFLYEGKHLPPCCRLALKNTLEHVVSVLTKNEARFWLEGGSLLGAARNGDIINWDYDIDLGIYLNDTSKVQFLQASRSGPVVDPEGFVWEMSQPHEGQFFRVHYSRSNRNHVDIFPFYSNNSIMTKDFWFATHPQDREFPEKFLLPVSWVTFMGVDVPAPNNVRAFLELKFGEGCIETPKYPKEFENGDGLF